MGQPIVGSNPTLSAITATMRAVTRKASDPSDEPVAGSSVQPHRMSDSERARVVRPSVDPLCGRHGAQVADFDNARVAWRTDDS